MAKRKFKDEIIYNRVRTKGKVYVLDRHDYHLPPTLKSYKITGKSYVDYGFNKCFYLYYGRGIRIDLWRHEVYTSKKRAIKAYLSAYRTHIKKSSEHLNKLKGWTERVARQIPAKKASLKRLEKKYGVR